MSVSDAAVEAADEAFWACDDLQSKVSMRAALEAAAPHMLKDASADVAAAFANEDAAKRALVARAAGVDPETARSLGY